MPKRKERPIEDHSDAEVLTLIVWGKTRIARLKQEQADVERDIKKWKRELKDRERQCRRG